MTNRPNESMRLLDLTTSVVVRFTGPGKVREPRSAAGDISRLMENDTHYCYVRMRSCISEPKECLTFDET